jgi:hypothetical protein
MASFLKKLTPSLLTTEAIIFWAALFNFTLMYKWAHELSGICFLCPWYYPWHFGNAPSVLLVAAACLWLSKMRYVKWDGLILAVALSVWAIFPEFEYLRISLNAENIKYWNEAGPARSRLFQFALTVIIISRAIWRFGLIEKGKTLFMKKAQAAIQPGSAR